jgi:hypothetical protein
MTALFRKLALIGTGMFIAPSVGVAQMPFDPSSFRAERSEDGSFLWILAGPLLLLLVGWTFAAPVMIFSAIFSKATEHEKPNVAPMFGILGIVVLSWIILAAYVHHDVSLMFAVFATAGTLAVIVFGPVMAIVWLVALYDKVFRRQG